MPFSGIAKDQGTLKLILDAGGVGAKGVFILKIPLLAFARRIADHAGSPADDRDDAVTGSLKPHQGRDHHEVA
jgi:hypothetical protein